jgi:hypothetical protein
MRRILATMTLAAGLCCILAGQASAWTCVASGPSGRSATGSAILEERARGIAMRRCARRNSGPCTIQACRP